MLARSVYQEDPSIAGIHIFTYLISFHLIKYTFTVPAPATAANGTSLDSTCFIEGLRDFNRGTACERPTAIPQDAVTAER